VVDLQTYKIKFVTHNCYDSFGYTAEEYLNMTMRETLIPEHFNLAINLVENGVKEYRTTGIFPRLMFEAQQHHKDGSLK
jgi:hypothetical protein